MRFLARFFELLKAALYWKPRNHEPAVTDIAPKNSMPPDNENMGVW